MNMLGKAELRRRVLARRDALTPAEIADKSRVIINRLYALPAYRQAGRVMFFVSFGSEVATGSAIRQSLHQGKQVMVPKTMETGGEMVPSLLVDYPGDLAPGRWGILEPTPRAFRPVSPTEIDLVVVPGVAFDSRGNRLGYGGGYYDRFFTLLNPGTTLVALAFSIQVVEKVPVSPWDRKVDYLVTEAGLYRFSRRQEEE